MTKLPKNICDKTKKKLKYFVRLTLLRIPKFSNCDQIEETQNLKTEETIVKTQHLHCDQTQKLKIKPKKKNWGKKLLQYLKTLYL